MTDLTEEQLAELIAALRPPPEGWVQAAVELPAARAAIDELGVRAQADRQAREMMLADLEAALREVGVDPRPLLVEQLRVRLSRLDG
ncbi:MAG: hypothetical protein ACJ764_08325 [Solirubrobacteraceae bacterium]